MFKLMKVSDVLKDSDKAFVSIRPEHISFNKLFCKIADLKISMRVKVFADSENYQIGFSFVDDSDKDSLALSESGKNLFFGIGDLKNLEWFREVTKLPMRQRRFEPKLEKTEVGKIWIIKLCPSFEIKKSRETDKINPDEKGIYRYKRAGETVYIGRGSILDRLRNDSRKDWDFDLVEYSRVENPDEQAKWEYFWLEKYKEENDNKLPIYNKIMASTSKKEE